MWLLLKLILVMAVAAAAVTLLGHGPGYMLIQVGGYTLETTVALGVIVILLVLGLGWLLWGTLTTVREVPYRLTEKRRQRRLRRSLDLLERGLLALERGDSKQAQTLLSRGARLSDRPHAFYLEAARAAHANRLEPEAERFLQMAQQGQGEDELAATLLRAEFEMESDRFDHALSLLSNLERRAEDSPYILRRLLRLYRNVEDWEGVLRILPRLRRLRALDAESAYEEGVQARSACLELARRYGNSEDMERHWEATDRRERLDPRIVAPRVRWLLSQEEYEAAARLLEQTLKRNWRGELVDLYLEFPRQGTGLSTRLQQLEDWLAEHPEDPHLLTVLAQLSADLQLWGKTDQYLDSATGKANSPDLFLRLARLYQQREQMEKGLVCYRKGLDALEEGAKGILPAPASGTSR